MRNAAVQMRNFIMRFHRPLAIGLQLMIIIASNRLAWVLRFDGNLPQWAQFTFWQMLPWLVAIRAIAFFPFRLYEGLWRYTSIYDLQALIGAVSTSSIVFYAWAHTPFGPAVYPRSIYISDACLLVLSSILRWSRHTFAVLASACLFVVG